MLCRAAGTDGRLGQGSKIVVTSSAWQDGNEGLHGLLRLQGRCDLMIQSMASDLAPWHQRQHDKPTVFRSDLTSGCRRRRVYKNFKRLDRAAQGAWTLSAAVPHLRLQIPDGGGASALWAIRDGDIKNVLVVGAGLMGKNIAFVMTANRAERDNHDVAEVDVRAGISRTAASSSRRHHRRSWTAALGITFTTDKGGACYESADSSSRPSSDMELKHHVRGAGGACPPTPYSATRRS